MVKLTADHKTEDLVDESLSDENFETRSLATINLADEVQPPVFTVYLAYAETAQCQHYLSLQVDRGTTLIEALRQAGWLATFTELGSWCEQMREVQVPSAKRWHVGVYAQKQPLHYQLQASDRIEVYRSLSADPMSQRKSKSRSSN